MVKRHPTAVYYILSSSLVGDEVLSLEEQAVPKKLSYTPYL
jgi:hypothetical protein